MSSPSGPVWATSPRLLGVEKSLLEITDEPFPTAVWSVPLRHGLLSATSLAQLGPSQLGHKGRQPRGDLGYGIDEAPVPPAVHF